MAGPPSRPRTGCLRPAARRTGDPRRGRLAGVLGPYRANPPPPGLSKGVRRCPPESYCFPGRRPGAHLGVRMVELIVRRAAADAGLGAEVTAMTLRHSFALHALRSGVSIRRLQEWLGHRHLAATLRYTALILPRDAVSPLDRMYGAAPQPVPGPGERLYAEPLTTRGLAFPFRAPSLRDFLAVLRMQIADRFLAARRGAPPGG